MVRRIKAAAIAGLLLTTLTLSSGCSLFPTEEEATPTLTPPVKTEKVTYTVHRGALTEQVSLRARLAPARTADLFSPADGRLKRVYVRPGQVVAEGQLLADLFTAEAEYQLEQARIQVEKARLAVETATYKRQFTASPEAQAEVKSRELDLQSAQLTLARWERAVADSRITAPFAGQVTAVNAKPGEVVAAYSPVVSLADPSELVIEADVSASDLERLAVGQSVRLEFSGMAEGASGTLVALPDAKVRAAGANNQPMRVRILPSQPVTVGAMGAVGRASIILQEKKGVLLLPKAGVRQFSGRTYVLTKEPRREVDVVLGLEGETDWEIVKGLAEGDQVLGR